MRITQALISRYNELVATPIPDIDKEGFGRLVAHDILENQIFYKDISSIIMGYVKESPEEKKEKAETLWKLWVEFDDAIHGLKIHRIKRTKSEAIKQQCLYLTNYLTPKWKQLSTHPLIKERVEEDWRKNPH